VWILAAGVVVTGTVGKSLLRVGLSSHEHVVLVMGVLGLVCCYLLQLALLSRADLTYAIPTTSISYVLVVAIGAFGLHEHVSVAHWVAVLLITAGVVIVGRTSPLTTEPKRARGSHEVALGPAHHRVQRVR